MNDRPVSIMIDGQLSPIEFKDLKEGDHYKYNDAPFIYRAKTDAYQNDDGGYSILAQVAGDLIFFEHNTFKCDKCSDTGWREPIGPHSDGSYTTSRPCSCGQNPPL